jgi:hypothetical protein
MLRAVLLKPGFRTLRHRTRIRVRVSPLQQLDLRHNAWSSQDMGDIVVESLPGLEHISLLPRNLCSRDSDEVLSYLKDLSYPQPFQPRIVIPKLRHYLRGICSSGGGEEMAGQVPQEIAGQAIRVMMVFRKSPFRQQPMSLRHAHVVLPRLGLVVQPINEGLVEGTNDLNALVARDRKERTE